MTATKPPLRLLPKGPGRRFWREITSHFEASADELLLLEAVCRCVDDLSRLEAELADAQVLVVGSKGQKVPNGLFGEVRAHRATLARLLAQLDLEDEAAKSTAKSDVARKLALLRWGSRNGYAP